MKEPFRGYARASLVSTEHDPRWRRASLLMGAGLVPPKPAALGVVTREPRGSPRRRRPSQSIDQAPVAIGGAGYSGELLALRLPS